ncbi:MAG TPA: hypothetical protein VGR12_04465 [Solirubrobacteraceae bacterium]|nr:hypothetical protein [Solirubrobacteraceae bacterium]
MAFFDEGDEPRTRVARPSRPAGARAGGGGPDPDAVRNRRIVAGLFAFVVAVLLFVLIDGCIDRRAENALKDYNRDAAEIVRQSDEEVGAEFFGLLGGGGDPIELERRISELRSAAAAHVEEAESLDVPDEMVPAHRNLLLVLDMRQAALGKIASEIGTATAEEQSDESAEAVDQVTAQMQQFLASDVVYDARVLPLIREELDAKEIGGEGAETQDSQFLPSLDWLDANFVADRLGAEGGGNTRDTGEVAPGLHGHGLVGVSAGDVTLEPGQAANRIPAGSNVAFTVRFANQGDNPEEDVNVAVLIEGDGQRLSARKRVEGTEPGATSEVTIPLAEAPPIGTPVTIEVEVGKVPGEEKLDNNTQTYTAIFTR